ncbi:MAG: TerB family tellurite resistance protein [Myxococcales bacterium]|nr:TerB family tellurite resistance protein [Myxococcales bacterium]
MSVDTRPYRFKLLRATAWANGTLDENERRTLNRFARSLFSGDEMDTALRALYLPLTLDEALASAPLPEHRGQRFGFELLHECIAMAGIDGVVDERERAFLHRLGETFRFENDFVNLLIENRPR